MGVHWTFAPMVDIARDPRWGRIVEGPGEDPYLASQIAADLGAARLVIAGGTAGVLDDAGATIRTLTSRDADRLIRAGTANKGMIAKLQACRTAVRRGVQDVVIANGRQVRLDALTAAATLPAGCTQVVR